MAATLLVVEDDKDMQNLIHRTLARDVRLDVKPAVKTASQAVEMAREVQPDLVVLDHHLQGKVGGLESAGVLKTIVPHTKIIVFSGVDVDLDAFLHPEVDAYLQKNHHSQLLRLVQKLLGLSPGH